MFVLDTDTLTLLATGHPRVLSRREQLPSEQIAITVVARIETLQGRFEFLLKAGSGEELLRAQDLLDRSTRMLADIQTVLPVTPAAAAEFDRLRQHKKLKKIGRSDLLIASIVLAHRAVCVTRNLKHFQQIPGLQVENWAD
ncbi:MAG: type II toxin-antitoxin system VapC family toxin [Acidobacteria bacterium]|nr:type II toxin-antitoxin system VapC family toxin [Acidobacteriota bacterium]